MAFDYWDIKDCQPQQNEVFLFDANVWIFYLNQVTPDWKGKKYNRFLDLLVRQPDDPHVILPAAVLSEVLNNLLRKVYAPQFLQSATAAPLLAAKKPEEDDYKHVYRKHKKYLDDRETILNSIFSYSSNLQLISDDFDQYTLSDLTTAFTDLDFTDWLVYELAKKHNATIVTDDGDFHVDNHCVITGNPKLISLGHT